MKSIFALCACLMIGSLQADANSSCPRMEQGSSAAVENITASELRNMMKMKPELIVVDARTAQFDDKKRIGNAISLPCDSEEAVILAKLPKKDVEIVVYCQNVQCPQSKTLAGKLKKMGYTKVKECAEGVQGWQSMGYPVTQSG